MDRHLWYLKNCELFERLPPETVSEIEGRSYSRQFAKGSLVYLPKDHGDALLLLASGRVKLYHVTADGKQAVLALVEPGELFGELAVLDDGPREEFAEAMQASTVVLIPGTVVRDLMAEFPYLAMNVSRLMGLRRRRVERRLKSLLFRSNRERLVALLLELAERYGKAVPEGILLEIKLSHGELAGIIGSTRETVTLLLGELQREGLLDVVRRQIVLKRKDALEQIVGERGDAAAPAEESAKPRVAPAPSPH